MGIKNMLGFGRKNSIQAIIVYPTKHVELKKVRDVSSGRFKAGKANNKFTYLIDEEAIYHFKDKPLLFYRSGMSSPIAFTRDGLENTLSSEDFTSVINSKVVQDLLKAGEGDFDLNFLLQMATLAGLVVILLNDFGVLNLG